MTMRPARIVAMIVSLAGLPALPQRPATVALPSVQPSIVRIEARGCRTSDRVATGFLWRESATAVTALHVVSGCATVAVYFEIQQVSRTARVVKILKRAD